MAMPFATSLMDGSVPTREDYTAPRETGYIPTPEEARTLEDVENRIRIVQTELYDLHSLWYQVSLFKHGHHYTIFNAYHGETYSEADIPDGQVRLTYNILQAVQNQTQTYFLDSPPKHITRALTEDGEDIEKSKVGGYIVRHFETHAEILNRIRPMTANWVTTLGNGFVYVGWDPQKGPNWTGLDPETGQQISEPAGDWVVEVVPPYQMAVDPNAKDFEEARWCARGRWISRDWIQANFPDVADQVPDEPDHVGDIPSTYEHAWTGLSYRRGTGRDRNEMPSGRGQVYLWELFEKPSPWHPRGRYIIWTGNSKVLLYAGPNPSGKQLPFAHFPFIRIEGSLWSRTTLFDLVDLQLEINRRMSQKSEHANLLGNPPMFHFDGDGLDEDNVSNVIGQIIALNPNSYPAVPFFPPMPELSQTVREIVPETMRFVDFISGNFGPSRGEATSQIRSGAQQMQMEESDARNMQSYMIDWEAGWQKVYRLGLALFQRYAALPRKIKVVGSSNQWRLMYVQNSDLIDDTDVEVVAGSTFPSSRSSMFTQMLALLQAGAFDLNNPQDNQRFWEAIQMGDMVRIISDKKLDREKAQRNIARIKMGARAMYDPVSDDATVHLDVIGAWIKTSEFEEADEKTKILALMYRYEVLAPMRTAMNTPTVPEGFPMFMNEGGGASAGMRGGFASQAGPVQENGRAGYGPQSQVEA